MGFAIANPETYERFALVPRRERPVSSWPSPPADTEDAPSSAWVLVGFLTGGGDEVAVYGLLGKNLRQRDGWASRVERLANDALTQHADKALTKAQIRDVLESILAEIV